MSDFDLERVSRLMLDELGRVHGRLDSIDTRVVDLRDEVRTIRHQLEERETTPKIIARFTDEVDQLLGRLSAIEKHLGLNRSITA